MVMNPMVESAKNNLKQMQAESTQSRSKETSFRSQEPTPKILVNLPEILQTTCHKMTSWWFQPNCKILVKLDHLPR